jgi:hypothetical protein
MKERFNKEYISKLTNNNKNKINSVSGYFFVFLYNAYNKEPFTKNANE